ncbi:ABC transporter ATP-binding protein [Pseudonocardia sp. H11422]|uniref:ABC transporter ATP-binding protein n=1 Tax=Pseudonocardia sp. H11422 TaxID=2835866 RepID=UPI0027E3AE0E|nr:ABC transporter ATP-binding protein [Pseudonocardia sp. H11422]
MTGARLRIEGVHYLAAGRALVDDVSLTVESGEIVGLIGPNGSGKSSLLRTVYRVNRPAAGRVLVDGEDVWRRSARWVAQRVGVVLQDMPADFPLTVRDVVAMGRSAHKSLLDGDDDHDAAVLDAALGLLGLLDLAERPFASLSGGERQRVLVARAFTAQPSLLVMDEPTNHLDVRHQLDLLHLVAELGASALIALHDLNLAAMFCDRLCLLDGGRPVAVGTPREVLTPDRLAAVYGIDTVVHDHPRTGTPLVVVL